VYTEQYQEKGVQQYIEGTYSKYSLPVFIQQMSF